MPDIRIMNWNIEKLSVKKASIPTMANKIASVILDYNVDIAIILELTKGTGGAALGLISNAANALAAQQGRANDYSGNFVSYQTGGDCYGVIIKDLNVVRPIGVVPDPKLKIPAGTEDSPLVDVDRSKFATWPWPFLGPNSVADAYSVLPFGGNGPAPTWPLIDVYATPSKPRGAKTAKFGGASLGRGGLRDGPDFRMPCLLMFEILGGPNNNVTYVLPILACHLGAIRGSGSNPLARGQIEQYKDIHIAQKFQNPPELGLPYGSYINLNNNAVAIQELIVTGDFNVDFLNQDSSGKQNGVGYKDYCAWQNLTVAMDNEGSKKGLGKPGPPGPKPTPPFTDTGEIPTFNSIPELELKTANTSQGTIYCKFDEKNAKPTIQSLRGACFDNFFFGGARLSQDFTRLTKFKVNNTAQYDACQVVDVAGQIVQAGQVGAQTFDVSGIQQHYIGVQIYEETKAVIKDQELKEAKYHYAAWAKSLAPGAAVTALTPDVRLIGARFISDHLPTLVEFQLP
jgi:hypothetical protein